MAKPHKINCDEPALRALDTQKPRNVSKMIHPSNKKCTRAVALYPYKSIKPAPID